MVCVITDNEFIFNSFQKIIRRKNISDEFDFYYSSFNKSFLKKFEKSDQFKPILLKQEDEKFFSMYNLFISLHCKQLFPDDLVNNYRCINVHPGLNPYNRGWFPQVFSIINKLPVGVTIHEMDTQLDHGPIIYQREIEIFDYDTSMDVYQKILETEIEMLDTYIQDLIDKNYQLVKPNIEGNINYKTDFEQLCELNLEQKGTFGQFIDILRATTFEKYDNAYFFDKEGNKIYVSINLKVEEKS